MKRWRKVRLLVLLSMMTLTLFMVPSLITETVQASPDPVVNTNQWYSRPAGYSYTGFTLGTTLVNPTYSYDTSNTTYTQINYVRAPSASTYDVGKSTNTTGSFKVPTLSWSTPWPTIKQVAVVMTWAANATPTAGKTYAFDIAVGTSSFLRLWGPTGAVQAKTTQVFATYNWVKPAGLGGGAWTWEDITKTRFRITNPVGGATKDAYVYAFDIKLNILVVSSPKLFVDPASIIDTSKGIGSSFSVDVKIENVTNMYGYEFILRYDSKILTPKALDPLNVDARTVETGWNGWTRTGSTPWLGAADYSTNYITQTNTTGTNHKIGNFTFADPPAWITTGTTFGSVKVRLKCWTGSEKNDGFKVYIFNAAKGEAGLWSSAYTVVPTNSTAPGSYEDVDLTGWLVDEAGTVPLITLQYVQMRLEKTTAGTEETVGVDHAYLRAVPNLVVGNIFPTTPTVWKDAITVSTGYAWLSVTRGTGEPGIWGSGKTAAINFTVVGLGETTLNLLQDPEGTYGGTKLGDYPNANPIPHDVFDGYFRNKAFPFQATLQFNPASQSVNGRFSVEVNITNSIGLYSWQFNITYDTSVLTALDVMQGSFLMTSGTTTFTKSISDQYGWIWANCTLAGDYPGAWGNGTLATLQFNIDSSGSSNLVFEASPKTALTRWDYGARTKYSLSYTKVDGSVTSTLTAATIYLDPATRTESTPFTWAVKIGGPGKGNASEIDSWQFNVTYDTNVLTATDVIQGPFMPLPTLENMKPGTSLIAGLKVADTDKAYDSDNSTFAYFPGEWNRSVVARTWETGWDGWTRVGVAPWLGAADYSTPTSNYIYATTGGDKIGYFTFPAQPYTDASTLSSVKLRLKCWTGAELNDGINIYLYDGAAWSSAYSVVPTNSTAPGSYEEVDVTSFLSTFAKVNAARMRLEKTTSGTEETVGVDHVYFFVKALNANPEYTLNVDARTSETGWDSWTRVGSTPWLGSADHPTNYIHTSITGDKIGYFTFSDISLPIPTLSSVKLRLKCWTGAELNDGINVYLYNGTAWSSAYTVVPTSSTAPGSYEEVDVTSFLSTFAKVNAARMRLEKTTTGTTETVGVDHAYLSVKAYYGILELRAFPPYPYVWLIDYVDFKVRYGAEATTDDQYRIIYQVGTSAWQTLQGWTSAGATNDTRVYSDQPEPNDGTWSWADIGNINFRVECNVVGSSDQKRFYLFEVWITVKWRKAAFTKQIDDTNGWVWANCTYVRDPTVTETQSGAGTLANITFDIDSAAENSLVDFDSANLTRNVVGAYQPYKPQPTTTIGGTVTTTVGVPEFPMGAALQIALMLVMIYLWKKTKRRTKHKAPTPLRIRRL